MPFVGNTIRVGENLEQWSLNLIGGFKLIAPSGEKIKNLSAKANALIAILVLSDRAGVSRMELAQALWPHSNTERQGTSLRQEIKRLRDVLGDDSFFRADRYRCWIDWAKLKMESISASNVPDLVPEFREPWFERFRETGLDAINDDWDYLQQDWLNIMQAANSLHRVMEWTAKNQPRTTLVLARDLPDLVLCMPPRALLSTVTLALSKINSKDELYGWGKVNTAFANMLLGELELAGKQFYNAIQHAKNFNDIELLSIATFCRASLYIAEGEPQKALQTYTTIQALSRKTKNPLAKVRYYHGMGLSHIHSGNFKEGIIYLQSAKDYLPDQIPEYEKAYLLTNIALLTATIGEYRMASELLVEFSRSFASHSWRLAIVKLLAQSSIAYGNGSYKEAYRIALEAETRCRKYEVPALLIYALELTALACQKLGDIATAQRAYKESQNTREAIKMKLTAWDNYRLMPLQGLK
jgi:tetratricopeptide (TPR) repeat protein